MSRSTGTCESDPTFLSGIVGARHAGDLSGILQTLRDTVNARQQTIEELLVFVL